MSLQDSVTDTYSEAKESNVNRYVIFEIVDIFFFSFSLDLPNGSQQVFPQDLVCVLFLLLPYALPHASSIYPPFFILITFSKFYKL
jgi:hypothetical protein